MGVHSYPPGPTQDPYDIYRGRGIKDILSAHAVSSGAIALGGGTVESGTNIVTGNVLCEAGRRYRISGYLTYVTSGNQFISHIRRTNVAGVLVSMQYHDKQTNGRHMAAFEGFDAPGAGTFAWMISARSDVNNWDVYQPALVIVEDVGPA